MSDNNRIVKTTMLSIIALIIIAVFAFLFIKPLFIKKSLPKPVVIDTQNQPTLGNGQAKVHFVAFEDLKCNNCARFNRDIMPYIKKKFIDTGVANYTMINLAFIPGSMPAANAARCVYMQNNDLFFAYTDYIFHHQPPEDQNWATVPNLLIFASKVNGINSDQLAQCLVKSPYDQFMQDNLKQASKVMNKTVRTPTLYVNGIMVTPLTQSQIDTVVRAVE